MDFQTYLRQTFQQMTRTTYLIKINSAILKFRRHKSTLDDRREAIRELAGRLEFLRPAIKQHLNKKDENDIFNIANFGIRHHNKDQQTEYDKAI
jgi:hypothetical protein